MRDEALGTSWAPATSASALGLGHLHVARAIRDAWSLSKLPNAPSPASNCSCMCGPRKGRGLGEQEGGAGGVGKGWGQELAPWSSTHPVPLPRPGTFSTGSAPGPGPLPRLWHTSLKQAGPIAALQGAVPALKAELVLTLKRTHADRLHQRLGHARVPTAHPPLLPLQFQPVTGLVVCLRSCLRLQGQREDGQGLAASQSVQRGWGEHRPRGRTIVHTHPREGAHGRAGRAQESHPLPCLDYLQLKKPCSRMSTSAIPS